MVNRRRLSFLLTVVAVCFLCGSLLAFLSGDAQTPNNQQKQTATILRRGAPSTDQLPTDKELDDAATPIADLNGSSPPNPDRQLKNARYDGRALVKPNLDKRVASVIKDVEARESDVPVDKSDLIVEGQVTDSQAFLSNDKGYVYSEFAIKITDILEASAGLTIEKGELVTAEREGGRVRYPDGRIIRYGFIGHGSPMKGGKYLFFLAKTGAGNYRLITGYEVRGNKVFALDGARINDHGLGRWPFDAHNGEDYSGLRNAVNDAVIRHKRGGHP